MQTSTARRWGETRADEGAGGALRDGEDQEEGACAGRGGEANPARRARRGPGSREGGGGFEFECSRLCSGYPSTSISASKGVRREMAASVIEHDLRRPHKHDFPRV